MKHYSDLQQFRGVYLEDSWVLAIVIDPEEVTFELELVVLEDHALYAEPAPDEQHCYRRAELKFLDATAVTWSERGNRPAVDATGSRDFGNIDQFTIHDCYVLDGDWGHMEIETTSEPLLDFVND